MNQPPAKQNETSEQHARLAEIYGTGVADLSPELALRRQRLAHYHTMLSKAALKRANRNRQFPAPGGSDGQLAFVGFLLTGFQTSRLMKK